MNDYKVDALTTCELLPDELTPPPPPAPADPVGESAQSSDGTRLIWAKGLPELRCSEWVAIGHRPLPTCANFRRLAPPRLARARKPASIVPAFALISPANMRHVRICLCP